MIDFIISNKLVILYLSKIQWLLGRDTLSSVLKMFWSLVIHNFKQGVVSTGHWINLQIKENKFHIFCCVNTFNYFKWMFSITWHYCLAIKIGAWKLFR